MLINKKNLAKIKTIAVRMNRMGFGTTEELNKEIQSRYVQIELQKLND